MSCSQAVNLPQLRREQGRALYLWAGPFGLRVARGVVTHERIVECRRARRAGRTGEMEDWNALTSMLPQDTRVAVYK